MKNRRRTTTKTKRPSAPKIGRRKPSSTNANTNIALLKRERDEALEQQKATAEVLRVISASPGDLKPAFAVILENATHLCEANFGVLFLCEGDAYRAVAMHNAPSAYVHARQREPLVSMSGTTVIAEVARTKRTIQTADMAKDPAYQKNPQYTQLFVRLTGARSFVAVPMLKDNDLIGLIGIYRQEVRPFTDKQIAVVESFAAQAVIAIENTRLLNELRQRTDDLTKSLEQQTATSEVLRVISSSPGDLEPVFQAMLANATRICEAKFGTLYLHDGGAYRAASMCNAPSAFAESRRRGPIHPGPGTGLGRVARTKQLVHIADITSEPAYIEGDTLLVTAVEAGGYRTALLVPMLKEEQLVGVISIYRQEVNPFTDKQIALVQNFAAQAVIAIENTRLLNELGQRTDDLTKSLEQQTATSEILASISGSMTDTKPVFDAIVRNLLRLFPTSYAVVQLIQDGMIHMAALNGEPGFERLVAHYPLPLDDRTVTGRAMLSKQVVQFARLVDNPDAPVASAQFARDFAYNSMISAPMIREDEVIGAIATARREPREFDGKQVALIKSFADQAVIAIENARLFEAEQQRTRELSESLEQQTATSEVLSVISSSPGELEPVFQAMLANATRLCEANFGLLHLRESGALRVGAMHNVPAAFAQAVVLRGPLLQPGPAHPLARMAAAKQLIHVLDYAEDPAYRQREPAAVRLVELAGARSVIAVPMLNDDELVGAITIFRQEVRPFTDKQIALVQNFAAQAVIAIENTRLLNELRESLQQQTATAEVLQVISSSPGELEPVFQAMLDNATRICEAKFGNLLLFDGKDMRVVAMHNAPREHEELRRHSPVIPLERSITGPLVRTKKLVVVADITAEEPYASSPLAKVGGARTALAVPMLRDDDLIGAITIYRQEVRPFTDKQIALVQNFAAQAVIAIENTRLLNELRRIAAAADGNI